MKIGFLCSEYFHYERREGHVVPSSAHGGFGFLTRKKAEALSKRGHEVHVLVPARSFDAARNEAREFALGDVQVHLYEYASELQWSGYLQSTTAIGKAIWTTVRGRIPSLETALRQVDADVYVSENPDLAACTVPAEHHNHVLVFQDPWGRSDIEVLREASLAYAHSVGREPDSKSPVSGSPLPLYDSFTNALGNALLARLLRGTPSGSFFAEAECISDRAERLYRLKERPVMLPNPIDVPPLTFSKADRPTAAWVGRWDPQKRIDIALEVARNCPEVEFYFIGAPTERTDLIEIAQALERRYAKYPNIHLLRFVDEDEKERVLRMSWVLLNTSVREGLPITFLEAAAHGLSIIAPVNPDGFASRFGTHVTDGDFVAAIRRSVKSEDFRSSGRIGYEHVRDVHETSHVIDQHIQILARVAGETDPSRARRPRTSN